MSAVHDPTELAAEAPGPLYASRVRVYPRAVRGPVRRFKWAVLIACLAIYYALPWLRWDRGPSMPDQAVLLDIWNERFYFFGLTLWPQDFYILTGLLILGALSLFLVTSVFGRVWCGYSCPQTVWTDLFMWVERLIEGDRNARMRRDAAPLSLDTTWRKTAKHAIWLGIAFWTGGAWITYYVDAPSVTRAFWTFNASTPVYFFTFLFTGTTYALAGWAREQVCTYMCPWPRFQSAMLDEQTLIVTYQGWRGEPRGHGKRTPDAAQARTDAPPLGDCVDCSACVNVCPTGIDIRDGVQLECINCGLCVDACNEVMQKVGAQPWLITWDTLARQAARKQGQALPIRWWRLRTMLYAGALLLVAVAITAGLVLRPVTSLSVLHDRAPLFVPLRDGSLRNGYTLKVDNKTPHATTFALTTAGLPDATMILSEQSAAKRHELALPVAAESVGTFRVVVQGRPTALRDGKQPLDFVLRDPQSGRRVTYRSLFVGPHGS